MNDFLRRHPGIAFLALSGLLCLEFSSLGFAQEIATGAPTIRAENGSVGIGSQRGTELSVPAELESIVRYGGVPQSLEVLRALETQQKRVASLATLCTVSVQISAAQGCGVIITGSGYILTAAHVATRPNKTARVTLSDGRVVQATTLGLNRTFDAGLLKIDPGQGTDWPQASLGTSEGLIPGMWCIATGHPGGYDTQRGPVTRVGRILGAGPDALLTDCALIGGDSGGPLFDLTGKLIAVHSRIGNDVAENLHVPIDQYAESWDRMKAGENWGFLPGFRPVLGVTGNSNNENALVEAVRPFSPADQAGLLAGDVIEKFNEVQLTGFDSLKDAVADTMPGERVEIWYRRDGQSRRIRIEMGRADR